MKQSAQNPIVYPANVPQADRDQYDYAVYILVGLYGTDPVTVKTWDDDTFFAVTCYVNGNPIPVCIEQGVITVPTSVGGDENVAIDEDAVINWFNQCGVNPLIPVTG